MSQNIDEYKKLLVTEIINFLKATCPMVSRNQNSAYLITGKHKGFRLDLEFNRYVSFSQEDAIDFIKADNSFSLSILSEKNQQQITALLNAIVTATNGYNLWRTIDSQLEKMPGWWHFFSSQRPLVLALKDVQKLFTVDDLKLEDDQRMRGFLEHLLEQIQALLGEIERLNIKCDGLMDEKKELKMQLDAGTISKDFYKEQLRTSIDQLAGEKEELIGKYDQLLKEFQQLEQDNAKLKDCITSLSEENEELFTQLQGTFVKLESGMEQTDDAIKFHEKNEPDAKNKLNDAHQQRRLTGVRGLFSRNNTQAAQARSQSDAGFSSFKMS